MTFHLAKKSRIVLAALLLLAVAVIVFLGYTFGPVNPRQKTALVNIPRGAGFIQIVDILDRAGFVNARPLFYALALARGKTTSIRAGEYELSGMMSPYEIIGMLVSGNVKAYWITVQEDMTMRAVASRLAAQRLVNAGEFLQLGKDRTFLTAMGIQGDSVEGFLYPETYKLDRSMTTREIMRMMVQQFWKVATPAMRQRALEMGMTIPQWVTLASIIGRESGVKDEKPLVAAVFHNRLKKGMKLQSDPTAVYDLEGFSAPVLRSHLLRKSPYNTYRIQGLPPGPIGNPAADSLMAALYPAKVDYLFFVANDRGTHTFSSTLAAHNRAVSIRQIQKKNE